jgi:hypothetical protein
MLLISIILVLILYRWRAQRIKQSTSSSDFGSEEDVRNFFFFFTFFLCSVNFMVRMLDLKPPKEMGMI